MVGELYEVDDVVLSRIDELEDHPTSYLRTKTVVVNLKGRISLIYFCVKIHFRTQKGKQTYHCVL